MTSLGARLEFASPGTLTKRMSALSMPPYWRSTGYGLSTIALATSPHASANARTASSPKAPVNCARPRNSRHMTSKVSVE